MAKPIEQTPVLTKEQAKELSEYLQSTKCDSVAREKLLAKAAKAHSAIKKAS